MAASSVGVKENPEAQLRAFIGQFSPGSQKLFRAVRAALRKRFPAANEMVYDYPDNLVISYTMTSLGKDGVVSTAARPDGLRVYFSNGKKLPDPKKLLMGSANVRYVPVKAASELAHPDIKALIDAAVALAGTPSPSKGRGELIIQKSRVAGKQRPRRKSAK